MKYCVTAFVTLGLSLVSQSQSPSITSFAPSSGNPGHLLSIIGNNFEPVLSNNTVFFGAVKAEIINAASNQLDVKIPRGALLSPISVKVLDNVAVSAGLFLPVYRAGPPVLSIRSFLPAQDHTSGLTPFHTAIGDLDDDGKPEIGITNGNSNTVSVLRNTSVNGTLSFATKVDFGTGITPYGIAISDVNLDGKPDIVVSNVSAASISILINTSTTGTISFAPKIDFAVGTQPRGIAIHDIDRDAKPDIIVCNNISNTISVFRNNSTGGSLSLAARLDFACAAAWHVGVSDLNLDGLPDLSVSRSNSTNFMYFQNSSTPGTIAFGSSANVETNFNPRGIVTADFDGDTYPDVITASQSNQSISTHRNTTAGGVISFGRLDITSGIFNSQPEHLAAADFNGDGKPDLVVANRNNSSLSIFRNTSTAGTMSFLPYYTMATATQPQHISAGDVNIDGKADIIVTSNNTNKISIFKNIPPIRITGFSPQTGLPGSSVTIRGYHFRENIAEDVVRFGSVRGTITAATDTTLEVTVPSGATHQALEVTADAMTAHSVDKFIPAFIGGVPSLSNIYRQGHNIWGGSWPVDVCVNDFNNDGKNDIAMCHSNGGDVKVVFNNSFGGNLSFNSGGSFIPTGDPVEVGSGDFDGDGRPDIAVSTKNNGNYVHVYRNTFPTWTFVGSYILSGEAGTVHIRDIDGDAKPDLVVGNLHATIYPNISTPGNIAFGVGFNVVFNNIAPKVVIGDFDLDGKADFIAGYSFSKNNSTHSNLLFADAVDFYTDVDPKDVETGDFNGDGKLDIAMIYASSRKVVTFLNTSTPNNLSFSRQTAYLTGLTPSAITVSDLNGDNKPDIAVSNAGHNSFSVYANTSGSSNITFNTKFDYATSKIPNAIVAGDFDGDSKNDLVVTTHLSNVATLFRYNIFSTPAGVPVINSFTPLKAKVGEQVTISGENFGVNVNNNTVRIGTMKTQVISASANSLTVVVPAGAGTNNITVTNNNSLTAWSGQQFITTFDGGGGQFTSNSFDPYKTISVALDCYTAIAADIDDDGKSELITVNQSAASISIFKNNSSPGFISFLPKVNFPTQGFPFNVDAGDLNGDGKLDLVVSNTNGKSLTIYINNSVPGTIQLAAPIHYNISIMGDFGSPKGLRIRDLDGNGKPDIAVIHTNLHYLSILENTTVGNTISFKQQIHHESGNAHDMRHLIVQDLDNNGKPDVASVADISLFTNTSVPDTTAFTAAEIITVGDVFSSIAAGDLNNDGKIDLALTVADNRAFTIRRNTGFPGTIQFTDTARFGSTLFTSHKICINDINGDGKPDIGIANLGSSGATLFRNRTTSTNISISPQFDLLFTGPVNSTVGLELADLDGDGKQDVISVHQTANLLSIWRNKIGEPFRSCIGSNATFNSNITGTGFQWQVSTDGGTTFTNLSNDATYSGTNTANLTINNISASLKNNRYRVTSSTETSEVFILRFNNNWTGAVSNAWENPANWSCGFVPDEFTDVYIPENANVVVNSNVIVSMLFTHPNGNVTVNSPYTLEVTGL